MADLFPLLGMLFFNSRCKGATLLTQQNVLFQQFRSPLRSKARAVDDQIIGLCLSSLLGAELVMVHSTFPVRTNKDAD